ncbi:arylsulfatase [Roseimaritima ulvae]|uniref:Arylsulfatase n=1 Tax=Roseimaritima ulvae TaxID=980254 RepID=A0A5B9QWJ1_9BACT|nr:arylsulfatase [Roseimaritima ulvae]QEG43414.1 Arylsulfatase [Roseimaritima ulvae]
MRSISSVLTCCFMLLVNVMPASLSLQAASPNVVVILTDDQGWGDLSVNGNSNLSTPHIDSLARDGATLNNFYVCPVCSPTRAEFLTGRYHPRTGVSGVSRGQERLNADEVTIADVMRQAGYATGAFGKWHNGTQPPLHPNYRGFDEYYGFTSGHWGHYFSPPLDHNGDTVRGDGFVVDDFTNHAIEFIQTNRDRPFFCYLPLNTPHSPMMVEDRFYDKFATKDLIMKHRDPDREDDLMTRAALAMCENIDWNVGRVLQTLDELNLADNTIVIYFSDNGPNSFRWNGGMKGKKGSTDEGGVRSPLFVRWPNRIQAGLQIEQVSGAIDLLPTISSLVGVTPEIEKAIDGRNMKPLLLEESVAWIDREIVSTWGKRISIRTQRFRLDAAGALYDIRNDRGQTVDVSAQYPDETKRLRKVADQHRQEFAADFKKYADRPFTVGFAAKTVLPARDAVEHGTIMRSAKPPNNSFFKHWTSIEDSITWDVDVVTAGVYKATLLYTCAAGDQGATVIVSVDEGDQAKATVTEVFDPPLYDKSKERVKDSHYFVKDFRPLEVGTLNLRKGRATLRLKSDKIVGQQVVDVHSIQLDRVRQ